MTVKNRGMVMQTLPQTVIVLTSGGEFISIPWNNASLPSIGSEVEIPQQKLYHRSFFKRCSAVGAVAACILVVFLSVQIWLGYFQSPLVAAYVDIDINPSIGLGLDSKDRVLEAKGLNEDGVKLLKELNLKNTLIEEALLIIIQEAAAEQYLSSQSDNMVLITVSGEEKLGADKDLAYDTIVQKALREHNLNGKAELLITSLQFRENARQLGLSTGKYAVLLEAEESGIILSSEVLKQSSIVKAVKEAGGNPGTLVSRIQAQTKQKSQDKEEKQNKEQTRINDSLPAKEKTQLKEKTQIKEQPQVKEESPGKEIEEKTQLKERSQIEEQPQTERNMQVKEEEENKEQTQVKEQDSQEKEMPPGENNSKQNKVEKNDNKKGDF